ncbi:MAG TPA: hypothetical protein DDZ81_13245, partial [Acetobacteraceae bacterium]|nr:hypothetical protein [Acetobacteraceae bacterium]
MASSSSHDPSPEMLEVLNQPSAYAGAGFRPLFPARNHHDSVVQVARGIEISKLRPRVSKPELVRSCVEKRRFKRAFIGEAMGDG